MFNWLSWLLGRRRRALSKQQFATLVHGLHDTAAASMDIVGEQYVHLFDQYFDSMPDGARKPKIVRLQLDDEHYLTVPLVSLVPTRGISLERMRVTFSTRLDEQLLQEASQADQTELDLDAFSVQLVPHSQGQEQKSAKTDVFDVIMEFRAQEAPDSVRQLIREHADTIAPHPKA